MWKCNSCNTENDDNNNFCIECAAKKPGPSTNHCSNPACKSYSAILPNPEQKYCGVCGSATTYWKMIEDMT
jgi:hypothetical protein